MANQLLLRNNNLNSQKKIKVSINGEDVEKLKFYLESEFFSVYLLFYSRNVMSEWGGHKEDRVHGEGPLLFLGVRLCKHVLVIIIEV